MGDRQRLFVPIAVDPHSGRLLFLYGKESDKIARHAEIIKDLDQLPRGPIIDRDGPARGAGGAGSHPEVVARGRENQLQVIPPADAAPGEGYPNTPSPDSAPGRGSASTRPHLDRPGHSPSKSAWLAAVRPNSCRGVRLRIGLAWHQSPKRKQRPAIATSLSQSGFYN